MKSTIQRLCINVLVSMVSVACLRSVSALTLLGVAHPDRRPNRQTSARDSAPPSDCFGSNRSDDLDRDGVSDRCETWAAERYAPIILHSAAESNWPTNVGSFLSSTDLRFENQDCGFDRLIKAKPSMNDLVAQSYEGDCGNVMPFRSAGTWSAGKHRGFYLKDVSDDVKRGAANDPRQWITYVHSYRNSIGGLTIQFWRFYAFNSGRAFTIPVIGIDAEAGFHGGDWEASYINLDAALNPESVVLLGHQSISPPTDWTAMPRRDTHILLLSQPGGHTTTQLPASASLDDCISQETWTGGVVTRGGTTMAASGGLVNVGERQHPLGSNAFIEYSGLWGSPSAFRPPRAGTSPSDFVRRSLELRFFTSSGYWGPAFNETGMVGGRLAAWCYLREADDSTGCQPLMTVP